MHLAFSCEGAFSEGLQESAHYQGEGIKSTIGKER